MTDTQEAKIEYFFDWVDMWEILNSTQQVLAVDEVKPKRKRKLTPTTPEDLPFSKEIDVSPKIISPRTYKAKPKYEIIDRPSEISVRESLNDLTKASSITPENAFKLYSGMGKLHDVEFKECESFHDYTKAKQEFEMGQFYTPDWLCQSIVNLCEINDKVTIMDPTCGTGRFFNWLPNEMNVY